MIVCTDLSKTYSLESGEVPVLSPSSLSVSAGEFIALMGPSGSGKSTLIKLIAGLELPTTGTVSVNGRDITSMTSRARAAARLRDIGVVFQDHLLLPELSLVENVELPLRGLNWARSDARDAALEALDRFDIGNLAMRFPHEISGGEQQRAGIARAVVGHRRVLLADEPTGSLDRRATGTVVAALRQAADSGLAVIVATHDHSVASHADRLLSVDDGRIQERHP